ncbi:type II toxin-antitoxin system CcdA family antitoxin [Propionivibrio sp.]|uniref:type II toxin-antitoxin system CcdA family antitoxin n=1 Tax=Propionivibrio sp. TaxID=2212460 RepID=UPI003BF28351
MRRQLAEESRATYFSLALLSEGGKKKMSLSISEPLAEAARQLNINLSRAAETGILQEIKRRRDSAWLEKNHLAIAAYNERVEREGLFGDEYRGF